MVKKYEKHSTQLKSLKCARTLIIRFSSVNGGSPVQTANLQQSSAICSVIPSSLVCKRAKNLSKQTITKTDIKI